MQLFEKRDISGAMQLNIHDTELIDFVGQMNKDKNK